MIHFTGTIQCGFLGEFNHRGVLTNDNELYLLDIICSPNVEPFKGDLIIEVNNFLSMGITDNELKDIIAKLNDPDKSNVIDLSMHHHCSIY